MRGNICAPPVTKMLVETKFCPTDKKDTEMLCEYYEWYGWYFTCLECGEKWAGGEMLDRPFSPGWRKQNVENAKKKIRLSINEKQENPIDK